MVDGTHLWFLSLWYSENCLTVYRSNLRVLVVHDQGHQAQHTRHGQDCPVLGYVIRWAVSWLSPTIGQLHGWVPHGQVILFCPLLGYVLMWAASWLNPWQGSYMAESHMGGYNLLLPLQGCVQSKPIVCPIAHYRVKSSCWQTHSRVPHGQVSKFLFSQDKLGWAEPHLRFPLSFPLISP